MDVVVSDCATLEMGPVGLTSVKLASLMKNSLILVTKHWKKKKKKRNTWEGGDYHLFFSLLRGWLLLYHAMDNWNSKHKGKKKKIELSREDHVSSKVGFLKFYYLLFLANNYETVILNIETIFCKTVLLPLLVEFELETKSPFGAETETTIWYLEQHLTWVLEFWRYIALFM